MSLEQYEAQSFAPLTLTLVCREGFSGEAALQEELNDIQEKLTAVERQFTRALLQTALMSAILVLASFSH